MEKKKYSIEFDSITELSSIYALMRSYERQSSADARQILDKVGAKYVVLDCEIIVYDTHSLPEDFDVELFESMGWGMEHRDSYYKKIGITINQ